MPVNRPETLLIVATLRFLPARVNSACLSEHAFRNFGLPIKARYSYMRGERVLGEIWRFGQGEYWKNNRESENWIGAARILFNLHDVLRGSFVALL